MDNLKNLIIEDYNYYLPPERIAQYPLPKRDESKLLVYRIAQDRIEHRIFRELPEIIDDSYLIIRNNTKVFPARFFLQKSTGGKVEVLIESPVDKILPEKALNSLPPQTWLCIMRGKNLNPGVVLQAKFSEHITIKATVLEIVESKRLCLLEWRPPKLCLAELLQEIGKIPLPEYIKREPESIDKSSYQTVFAQHEGSIAAPTAGLHFTEQVDAKLKNKGIEILELTLHVGSGTFVPLKSNEIIKHKMHSEQFAVNIDFLQKLLSALDAGKKIIAVGTTTIRTLESLYWLGSTSIIDLQNPNIKQWIWQEDKSNISPVKSLENLIEAMNKENKNELVGQTQLMIVPGYSFKFVHGMITNFHLPKSTLLLLVASFIGRNKMLELYDTALNYNYRFLSYGDASLLLK